MSDWSYIAMLWSYIDDGAMNVWYAEIMSHLLLLVYPMYPNTCTTRDPWTAADSAVNVVKFWLRVI